MSDEVQAIEPEAEVIVKVDDPASDTDQSVDSEADDDKEYDAGLAQAKEKTAPPEERSADETGKARNEKGQFVKKEAKAEEPPQEKAEEGGKKGEPDADLDEDELRGKEILEAEAAAEEKKVADEAARKAETDKGEPAETGKQKAPPPLIPLSQGDADVYLKIGGPEMFKGVKVKVNDVDYDMEAWAEANPEFIMGAGALMQNFLLQLQHAGLIPSPDSIKEGVTGETKALNETIQAVQDKLFVTEIKVHGVPDPVGLTGNEKFKPWLDKQKPELKALFRSDQPSDHAKALKRFMKDMNLPGMEKKREADSRLKAAKERKDRLFGTTFKTTPAASLKIGGKGAVSTGDDDAEYEAGLQEAREKHGKRRA